MGALKAAVVGGKYEPRKSINIPSGKSLTVGGTTIDENTLAMSGLTATAVELNKLDGATVTTAEINILDGVTATAAEINKLAGSGAVVASGTQAAFQADLATDANGTAIAGAVNGLRDTLVAFGIMAAS